MLEQAELIAREQGAQVGCLIVDFETGQPVATGYNRHQRNKKVVHAEIMALAALIRQQFDLVRPVDIYVTHSPCLFCYEVLSDLNLHHIYYIRAHDNDARYYYDIRVPYTPSSLPAARQRIPDNVVRNVVNPRPYPLLEVLDAEDNILYLLEHPADVRHDLINNSHLGVPAKIVALGEGSFTWREKLILDELGILVET